jgi:hypothetical protein
MPVSWFLAWFILRPWRWRRHISPKCLLTFNGLHCVVTQKIELIARVQSQVRNQTSLKDECLFKRLLVIKYLIKRFDKLNNLVRQLLESPILTEPSEDIELERHVVFFINEYKLRQQNLLYATELILHSSFITEYVSGKFTYVLA